MRRGADAGGEIDACKRFHDNSSATWPIRLRAKGGSADDVTTVCLGRRGSCDCAQDDGPRGSASVRRCGRPRALATGTRHGHSPRASAPAAWHGLSPRPRATAVSLDHLPRPFAPVTRHSVRPGHSPRPFATAIRQAASRAAPTRSSCAQRSAVAGSTPARGLSLDLAPRMRGRRTAQRSTRRVDSRATSSGGGRSAPGSSPLSIASIAAAASEPIS